MEIYLLRKTFEKKFEILVPIPFPSKYLNGTFISFQVNGIDADEYSGIVLAFPISDECHIDNSSIVA